MLGIHIFSSNNVADMITFALSANVVMSAPLFAHQLYRRPAYGSLKIQFQFFLVAHWLPEPIANPKMLWKRPLQNSGHFLEGCSYEANFLNFAIFLMGIARNSSLISHNPWPRCYTGRSMHIWWHAQFNLQFGWQLLATLDRNLGILNQWMVFMRLVSKDYVGNMNVAQKLTKFVITTIFF